MIQNNKILMGKGERYVYLNPRMANRHGLIAGATGTGKTITLEVMAEAFSEIGVPVFLADVKGDISGLARAGQMTEALQKRLGKMGIEDVTFKSFPVRFWDVYGEAGHPVRTTISEMGPLLLSRLLGLTEVQEGVLNIVFRIADDRGLLLIDLKDLKAMLQYAGQHAKEFALQYGTMSQQSLGAIQRSLLALEDQGGDKFFGEPDLKIQDWMQCDSDGRGYVNILHCVRLFQHPLLYSTFILWLLSELFETLPEAGDMDKPKMVFFFDEAHLLFSDAPKVLVQKVEQVVKLIRSKGVGVYFISQSPSDLPNTVLAQLSNRVQHALRAYTPAELKAVRAAAQSFRPNPNFKTEDAILDLGVGEALVSFLDEDGKPEVVERAKIICPQSSMSALDDAQRKDIIISSNLYGKYEMFVDRQSAYEDLMEQQQQEQQQAEYEREQQENARRQAEYEREQAKRQAEWEKQQAKQRAEQQREWERQQKEREREREREQKERERKQREWERQMKSATRPSSTTTRRTSSTKSPFDTITNTTMNTIGRELGRSLVRGLMGLLK